jgi:outer membrane phospholipase A
MKKIILFLLLFSIIYSKKIIDMNPKYKGFLSIHDHSYIIFNPKMTKLQISAKYKLINQLYGGYTALMFWDLWGDSSPFMEISHNPEIFYELKFIEGLIIDYIHFGLFEHKSNGRERGPYDRSLDRFYIKFNIKIPFNKADIEFKQKYFYLINAFGLTPGIYNYIGWYEYRLTFNLYLGNKIFNQESIYINYISGGNKFINKDIFGIETGLKIKLFIKKLNLFLFVQYYYGYAESMYKFNEKSNIVRFGFVLDKY